jgi:hypothetical protein
VLPEDVLISRDREDWEYADAVPEFLEALPLDRDRIIREYVEDWVVGMDDYTTRVRKIRDLLLSGKADKARRQLPPERIYPGGGELARRHRRGGGFE